MTKKNSNAADEVRKEAECNLGEVEEIAKRRPDREADLQEISEEGERHLPDVEEVSGK